jgi:hypothetical protein
LFSYAARSASRRCNLVFWRRVEIEEIEEIAHGIAP